RHFLAELMPVGIDASAHSGDEFFELPSLHQIEGGPNRPELTGHAAGPFVAVAAAAILIRQNVFAILQRRTAGWCGDDTGRDRFTLWKHTRPQHDDPQHVEMIGR